ncbi:hypothetical protein [Haloplanus salilacus]|uniref:hypothetical protein n=1 Tax=Haloplanus salilacus TaxID=2949994 RepID=UPI0030D4E1AF
MSLTPLAVPLALLTAAALSTPAAAHGTATTVRGLAFPAVVVASIGASLLGGGVVLALTDPAAGTDRVDRVLPPLLLGLGGLSITLALDGAPLGVAAGVLAGVGVVAVVRGRAVTDCDTCADAALGAVTLHRGLEGVVLATLYAADAALGVAGAAVLAVHAMAETAAVGSLYAATRRHAVGAVCLLQVGFVGGVAAGWRVVDAVPPVAETGALALVGAVLLAVGVQEGYHRYADRRAVVA